MKRPNLCKTFFFTLISAVFLIIISLPYNNSALAEGTLQAGQRGPNIPAPWADSSKRYRLPITAGPEAVIHNNKIAELEIDFTPLLSSSGNNGKFDPASLRMVEVDGSGTVLDLVVPFQFDQDAGYDAATKASGTLIWLVSGSTAAATSRLYHLYFDDQSNGPFAPVSVTPLVNLTDGETDEGQASLKITNSSATFYYHKDGGGFSSLLDSSNNDWINYSSAVGSAGDFRGIPNMVHPNDGGYFHPGRSTAVTQITHDGPLKATFSSSAAAGAWQVSWSIYPEYATLTVEKAAGSYWFLYEGTPGGSVDANDYIIRSSGTKTAITTTWSGDLSPEWLLFTDEGVGKGLFYAHHADDSLIDAYYLMDTQMTVFGFGRLNGSRYLTAVPNQVTIGFTNATTHSAAAPIVNNAYNSLPAAASAPETIPAAGSQDIALTAGWNLISSHIVPNQPALETLLSGIEPNMLLLKNGVGEIYWPSLNFNTIHNWAVKDGYYIYMDNPDTLSISGSNANPATKPISLSQGWNTIAYLKDSPLPIDQALSSISSELVLIKDPVGNLYWPGFGIDQILEMEPGSGYQIFVNSPASLQYP